MLSITCSISIVIMLGVCLNAIVALKCNYGMHGTVKNLIEFHKPVDCKPNVKYCAKAVIVNNDNEMSTAMGCDNDRVRHSVNGSKPFYRDVTFGHCEKVTSILSRI
jgi:hypothetical protein